MTSATAELDVSVEESGPCTRLLHVTVPAERVDREIETTMKQVMRNVSLPGFRPGKAPRRLIEAKLGDRVIEEVTERLVEAAVRESIQGNELDPVGQARLDWGEVKLEKGKALQFEFTIDVRPEFELPELKTLTVQRPSLEVTDESLDQEIERLRFEQATEAPAPEGHEIGEHDVANLKVSIGVGEESIVDGVELQWAPPSNLLGGMRIEGLADSLTGMTAGSDASFEVTLPDDFREERHRGRTADVKVSITGITHIELPAVDQAFAESMDYDDEAEMRDDIRKQLERRLEAQQDRALDDAIVDSLLEAVPFDVPPSLIEQESVRALRRYEMRLRQDALPEEQIIERVLEAKEEAQGRVARDLRASFILERIAADRKVFVTETEVATELANMAQLYQRTAAEMSEYIENNGLLPALRGSLRERNTLKELRSVVQITDAAPAAKSTEKPAKKTAKKATTKAAKKTTKKAAAKKSTKKAAKKASTKKTTAKKSTKKAAKKTTKKKAEPKNDGEE